MANVYFITHPDVIKDPAVPVPRWPLSPRGRKRMGAMLTHPWVRGLGAVYCSDEQKALDGAAILAGHLGLTPLVRPALGEIDRSSTGYLPEEEHAVAARLLFESPDESVRGWETADHAQRRIIQAIELVIEDASLPGNALAEGRDIAIVAHGAVGTLYLLRLLGEPIAFHHLQPGRDGGHYFCFDAATRTLHHEWRRIEPD
jgi:broad specificity phosphatase PhoE